MASAILVEATGEPLWEHAARLEQTVTALKRLLPVHQDGKRPLGLLQRLAYAGKTADPR
jgi:hypothetical protein